MTPEGIARELRRAGWKAETEEAMLGDVVRARHPGDGALLWAMRSTEGWCLCRVGAAPSPRGPAVRVTCSTLAEAVILAMRGALDVEGMPASVLSVAREVCA